MIQPDAKCVVNGKKLNAVIHVVNSLLKIANSSEEFDVVEQGNYPGKRWLLTGKIAGQKQGGAAPDRDNLGGHGGAGAGDNRGQLNAQVPPVAAPNGVGGVANVGVIISNQQGNAAGGPGSTVSAGMPTYPGDTGPTGGPSAMPTYPGDAGTTGDASSMPTYTGDAGTTGDASATPTAASMPAYSGTDGDSPSSQSPEPPLTGDEGGDVAAQGERQSAQDRQFDPGMDEGDVQRLAAKRTAGSKERKQYQENLTNAVNATNEQRAKLGLPPVSEAEYKDYMNPLLPECVHRFAVNHKCIFVIWRFISKKII